MSDSDLLASLFERNAAHTERLAPDHFADVLTEQRPPVVSVCCADSRVSQEGMWSVEAAGWLFTPSNIGNVVWDDRDGERIVDGSVHYPIAHTGTGTVAVVGHTGCGAITAAYGAVRAGGIGIDEPPGIAARIELLEPVVEEAIERGVVDPEAENERAINRLVEYNVKRQIEFLREADLAADCYGFVYDFQGIYGSVAGRAYLVSANGETDPGTLRERVPDAHRDRVRSLLCD